MKYVSFPREGSVRPSSGEGSQISAAIRKLHQYQTDLDKGKDLEKEDVKEIVSQIKNLFWYPKVPEENLIDVNTKEGKAKWKEIKYKKRYNAAAMPRDNDPRILYYLTARHIDTMASCFPGLLKKEELKDRLIEQFVETVARDWEMEKPERENFLKQVEALLNKRREELKEEEKTSKHFERQLPISAAPTEESHLMLFSKEAQKSEGLKKNSKKEEEEEKKGEDPEDKRGPKRKRGGGKG